MKPISALAFVSETCDCSLRLFGATSATVQLDEYASNPTCRSMGVPRSRGTSILHDTEIVPPTSGERHPPQPCAPALGGTSSLVDVMPPHDADPVSERRDAL